MLKHFAGCWTLSSVYTGTFCCLNFGQKKAQQKLTPVFERHFQLGSVFPCQRFTDVPSPLWSDSRLTATDYSSLYKAQLS